MLDFDTMKRMNETDPEAFELLRKKVIDRYLRKTAKNEQDLWVKRGEWRKIDMEVWRYKNKIMRMIIAIRLMKDKLALLNMMIGGLDEG